MVKKFDVFISHSSKDRELVENILNTLEENGLKCWISSRDIMISQDYQAAIIEGLENSKMIIVVLTENANASRDVFKEIACADNYDIPIVPFIAEDIELSKAIKYMVSSSQGIFATESNKDSKIKDLSIKIKQVLNLSDDKITHKNSIQQNKINSNKRFIPYIIGLIILVISTGLFFLKNKDSDKNIVAKTKIVENKEKQVVTETEPTKKEKMIITPSKKKEREKSVVKALPKTSDETKPSTLQKIDKDEEVQELKSIKDDEHLQNLDSIDDTEEPVTLRSKELKDID
jgi:hypothetical protein